MASLSEQIQRLSLSGLEIRDMTNWSDAMIEDYLQIGEALSLIGNFVDGIVTFSAIPTEGAGGGTVWGDMNATDWTGDDHAIGTALFIGENETCIVAHKGVLYQYIGDQPVTIGVGGSYTSVEQDYIPISTSDHQALVNRDSADCHPTSAITGLDGVINDTYAHIADTTIHGRYNESVADPDDTYPRRAGSWWYQPTFLRISTFGGWVDVTLKSAFDALAQLFTDHVNGVSNKHPATDITYADTTVPPFGAANVQEALVAVDLLIKGRVRWMNLWMTGVTYNANDMVLDGEWTMIANKTTTDRAAPEIDGVPAYYLPDSPTWTNDNYLDICYTGFRFQTVKPFVIDGLRAWLPDISPDIRYTGYLIDESDPAIPIILQAIELETLATAVGWVEVTFGTTFIPAGVDMTLMLVTRRFIPSPDWTWQWTRDNNAGTTPASGNYTVNGTNDIIYINQLDSLGTNRDADIGALVLGDEVTISEAAVSSRFSIYRVLAVPVLTAGVWAVSVIQLSAGGSVRNNRLCDVHAVPTTTVANAPYVYLPNYLTTSPPDPTLVTNVVGFLDNSYPPSVTNDNGYGIDMSFSGVTVSPDWDIVSHGTGEGVSAGAVWGQITGNVNDQTDMINEMNKRAIAMALALGG